MDGRLVLLHGWGANGEDLKPLGDRLARECSKTLDVVCLEAPEPHPDQPGGCQWYGLFPAQWDAVPMAVDRLKAQLQDLSTSGLDSNERCSSAFPKGVPWLWTAAAPCPSLG
jgi:phospholipase/carboxylesterase